jgi:hypothetical protein
MAEFPNKNTQFKKGESGNPKGYPKGKKNFKTLFYKAISKIAEQKDIDPESVEVQLILQAIKKANKGSYQFYKDVMDRVYGKAVDNQKIEHDFSGYNIKIEKNGKIERYND